MTRQEALLILRKHQEWRRYDGEIGEGPEMQNPTEIGIAIDVAIATLETICNNEQDKYKENFL